MVNNLIETIGLTKAFKLKGQEREITALNNVNLSIKEGEIYGLVGPNGAGKTTAINILTTLMQPTAGYAIIDGYNIHDDKNIKVIRKKVALMLGTQMLYYRITAYDNLKLNCKL